MFSSPLIVSIPRLIDLFQFLGTQMTLPDDSIIVGYSFSI